MASNIENIEGIIKEEVIYADVADVPGLYHVVSSGDCFVQEECAIVNGADVQCQEIVIENASCFQKCEVVETDGTFANVYEFDPNCTSNSSAQYFAFNSGSESSPHKRDASQTSSNNSFDNNNYINQHHSKHRSHKGQTLKEKQLELNNIKQFGTRLKNIKQDQDDWYPNNDRDERGAYGEYAQMGDDDYKSDYSSKRRNSGRLLGTGRLTKPKKRAFAERLKWHDKDMMEAMKKVSDHSMTIRGAAKQFNVPYSTLKDRVRGRVTHGTRPGVKTALSFEDEKELVRIINHMVECGFNIQCLDIREKAHEILKRNPKQCSSQLPNMPGHNWLSGFIKRHPDARVNKSSSRVASPSTSKMNVMLKRFFEVSSRVYRDIPCEDRPSRIYCMTSVQLPSLPKTSIILTASADGSLLAPYVVGNFDRNAIQLMQQAFPGAMFVSSSDMSRERLLLCWFKDFFLPKVKSQVIHNLQKPHVLFLNQSNRNVSIRLVELSIERNVDLVCMPVSLTQALQPLNSLSTSLEQCFQKCLNWVILNGVNLSHSSVNGNMGHDLNEVQVAQTLKKVFDKSESFREEIQKNFSHTGVYPLNSRAISLEKITASSNDDDYLGNFNESFEENHASLAENSVGDYDQVQGDRIQDEGGLHLLSELSTAVRTPPESSSYGTNFSNQLGRHPSTFKYRNHMAYNQVERRAPRMKRSAAGESEKFMKKILGEGIENEYDNNGGGERPSKRLRMMDAESDVCSVSSIDSELEGCARTRPMKSNHSSMHQDRSDSFSNDTLSEYDARELYNLRAEDIKSSTRYSQHQNSGSYNINDADIISQAVQSILPKEDMLYSDNSNIKLPIPLAKTPKIQYSLRKPHQRVMQNLSTNVPSLQHRQVHCPGQTPIERFIPPVTKVEEIVNMAIQEEVITNDLDEYFILNHPQLVSEEVTVEEIVMDDIVTAIYDEETASENLIFNEQVITTVEEPNMLNIEQASIEGLPNSEIIVPSDGFEHVASSIDNFVVDYEVESLPLKQQSIPNEDIILGDGVYKASQMVKMTTHLNLNNCLVQTIRNVTLQEAMETFQRNDPMVVECNLEFEKSQEISFT